MTVCTPIHVPTPDAAMMTKRSEDSRATRNMPHTSNPKHRSTAKVPSKPNSSPTIAKMKSVCAACK